MKRTQIIANLTIAVVLITLSVAIFSVDMGRIYETVAAPVASGNKNLKNVSLVLCIEPDTDGAAVDGIMDAIALRKVSATFFVSGSWVMKNPQRIKKMSILNFEIANYGFSGKSMKQMNAVKQKSEILDTHTLVKGLSGIDMKLFMPPLAEYNNEILKTAAALGYTVVVPSRDTKARSQDATAERIFTRATDNMKNGDLIQICPTSLSATAVPGIIDLYINQEFGIIKVSDNIAN